MKVLGALLAAIVAIAVAFPASAQTPTHRLSVSQIVLAGNQPARISSNPGGIDGICSTACSAVYPAGTRVTLNVSSPHFEWQGACKGQTGSSCTLLMDGDKSAVADFNSATVTLIIRFEQFRDRPNGFITIDPDPAGGGRADCIPSRACVRKYRRGTVVTIRQHNIPHTDQIVIEKWGDACAGQTGDCRIVMDGDRTVSGIWKYVNQTTGDTQLQIISNQGAGAYRITPPDRLFNGCHFGACTFDYPNGSRVTLEAYGSSGLAFDHWEGCDEPRGHTCTMVMGKGKTLRAFWTRF